MGKKKRVAAIQVVGNAFGMAGNQTSKHNRQQDRVPEKEESYARFFLQRAIIDVNQLEQAAEEFMDGRIVNALKWCDDLRFAS